MKTVVLSDARGRAFAPRQLCAALLVPISLAMLSSCTSTGSSVNQNTVVSTPPQFPEDRVYYIDAKEGTPKQPLKLAYELAANDQQTIAPNTPIAVIVKEVRVPRTFQGTKDIAVVLDVLIAETAKQEPIVAFYQQNVTAGQTLNFSDLVVYASPNWAKNQAPYFRVRLVDVGGERNSAAQALLSTIGDLSAKLSNVIPSLGIPGVAIGLQVAKYFTSEAYKDKMLLDFQFQLYGKDVISASGGSDLEVLRRGDWVVLGRPRDITSEDFWRQSFTFNRQTKTLSNEKDESVQVPFVITAISNADLEVPSLVMSRSHALSQLISSNSTNNDPTAIQTAGTAVGQALESYLALKAFSVSPDGASMLQVVTAIDHLQQAHLNDSDAAMAPLMRLIHAVAPEAEINTAAQVATWWNNGAQHGKIVKDADGKNRFGVRWEAPAKAGATAGEAPPGTAAPATTPGTPAPNPAAPNPPSAPATAKANG